MKFHKNVRINAHASERASKNYSRAVLKLYFLKLLIFNFKHVFRNYAHCRILFLLLYPVSTFTPTHCSHLQLSKLADTLISTRLSEVTLKLSPVFELKLRRKSQNLSSNSHLRNRIFRNSVIRVFRSCFSFLLFRPIVRIHLVFNWLPPGI